MALILMLLDEAKKDPAREEMAFTKENGYICGIESCKNDRCISSTEQELLPIYRVIDASKHECRCVYCEKKRMY
jgi:aspartate carbamoyltransferase regulatory subunit